MDSEKIITLLNVIKKVENNLTKVVSYREYSNPKTEVMDYKEYIKKILGAKFDFTDFSLTELKSIIDSTNVKLRELNKNRQGNIKEINEFTDKLKILGETWFQKKTDEMNKYRRRYTEFLKNKYSQTPLPEIIKKPLLFLNIDSTLINQVIQAYKRKLITDDPSVLKTMDTVKTVIGNPEGIIFVNYDYLPESIKYPEFERSESIQTTPVYENKNMQEKMGKLITYLELYDINEIYNKLKINNEKVINTKVYDTIKKVLSGYITDYITIDTLNKYQKISIQRVSELLGINSQANTITESIDILTKQWPKEYTKGPVDFYGTDVFLKLMNVSDQLDFYDPILNRNYLALVTKYKPLEINAYRTPGILFDEKTGKYGNQAFNGMLYQVQFLDKDFSNGLPFTQEKVFMEKDPRTRKFVSIKRSIQKRGKYPYILRQIGTNQVGVTQEIWLEVPKGSVLLYTPNYDSCSRFTTQATCKGLGLNNSACEFKQGKCQANYSFGKIKIVLKKNTSGIRYSLKDPSPIRHRALDKRVLFEKKKKKVVLRKAAVAVKRRLVVLKVISKKNELNILTKDINYITNKYLK